MLQQAKMPFDQTLRIVVADDDIADREMVGRLLKAQKNFFVEQTSSHDGLMSLLAAGEVDCVIVDRALGAESGFEINDRLKAKYPNPPAVIMLTSAGNERFAIKAFRGGFSNYVKKKPLLPGELIAAVEQAVARQRAEKLRKAELEHLSALALLDRITGFPNRQFLDERLQMLIASRKRRPTPFAILAIGINELAALNDRFGLAVGDAALKAFAHRLTQISRSSEILGRLSGATFLCLIDSNVSAETVELTCRRFIGASSFSIEMENLGLSLSASIGAAIFPVDGVTVEDLLAAAGRARRFVKSTGGGHALASTTRSASGESMPASNADNGAEKAGVPTDVDFVAPATPDSARITESLFAPPEFLNSQLAFELRDVSQDDAPTSENAAAADPTDAGPQTIHREENRRAERRQRVLKRGTIVTIDGNSTIDCVIRDLSPHGARVAVEAEYAAPPRFSLLIVETGDRLPAERRWQRGREVGLRFLN